MRSIRSILALRFARLGDLVLLLPALARLKSAFPNSRLTLMTGDRCAPLAELSPAIDEVIAVDRLAIRDAPTLSALRELIKLVQRVRGRRFDLVVDFHSFRETNLLAWLSNAPHRLGLKRYDRPYLNFCFNTPPVLEDKSIHVAEMFERVVEAVPGVVGAPDSIVPVLNVPETFRGGVAGVMPDGVLVSFYVGAAAKDRMWPPSRFAELADFVIECLGATVAVIAGRQQSSVAEQVRKAARHKDRIWVLTRMTIPQLVSVIASSYLLVSNDTGPMHIGPATGVPTLGLFSVGFPEHYRPLGSQSRFLRGNPIDRIEVENVVREVRQMWLTVVPGHPR